MTDAQYHKALDVIMGATFAVVIACALVWFYADFRSCQQRGGVQVLAVFRTACVAPLPEARP